MPCRRVRELPVNRKLLLPYFSRIWFSLGRLSPMVETWKSPVSMMVSQALAIGGCTPCFLYCCAHGAWSSKYCALAASFSISAFIFSSVMLTKLCDVPLAARGSR